MAILRSTRARAVVGLLLALSLASLAWGKKRLDPADVTNYSLAPEYSHWLVGAASAMVSKQELRRFMKLETSEGAEAFIESFWAARDPRPERPGNLVRNLFEQRMEEADRAFGEAGVLGRRTDRGTIYVLYGPPDGTDYEVNPDPRGEPIERWDYARGHGSGLDGNKPERVYRFVKREDLTVRYKGQDPGRPYELTPF